MNRSRSWRYVETEASSTAAYATDPPATGPIRRLTAGRGSAVHYGIWIAALATAVAGLAHYAAVPSHRYEWWFGAMFLTVVGATQLVWSVLAVRGGGGRTPVYGILLNSALLVLLLMSHTVGLPFGPHGGDPETPGPAEWTAALAEVAAVATLTWSVLTAWRSRPVEDNWF